MTQVTLLKDGISVDDRIYSRGEVVSVPDKRASELVKAGEADYAVEAGAGTQTTPGNTTHPVTNQGAPIDPETGEADTSKLGSTNSGTLGTKNFQIDPANNPTAAGTTAAPPAAPAQPITKK